MVILMNDNRGYTIVDAAVRLVLHAPAYQNSTIETVAEALVDMIRCVPLMLDHPDNCPGCDRCNSMSTPEGTTVQ